MPDQTPAEQLHAAAAQLRATAAAQLRATAAAAEAAATGPVGRHIALMHPGVGAALADWLEATAAEMDAAAGTEYEFGEFASWDAALAVARLIPGSPS